MRGSLHDVCLARVTGNNDGWRAMHVMSAIANPAHPASRPTIGSIKTLNRTDIRQRLLDFHRTHYSAHVMRLVVVGRENLDTLQRYTQTMFSAVPSRAVAPKTWLGIAPYPAPRYANLRRPHAIWRFGDKFKLVLTGCQPPSPGAPCPALTASLAAMSQIHCTLCPRVAAEGCRSAHCVVGLAQRAIVLPRVARAVRCEPLFHRISRKPERSDETAWPG